MEQATLQPGTLLRGGAYRVERALSSGGFGNTYVVMNLNFDELWAMKEFFMKGINLRDGNTVTVSVPENRQSFNAQRDKFRKEAQRLWKLKNDHIVKVHDLFEENGTVYYVMDFIDGESLSERIKRLGRPLTEEEVMPLLRQALDALESVHRQKIWHLDIKPANMMVDKQERLFLIDFGASKQLHTSDGLSLSTSSALAYTPGYAPLEQTDQNIKLFGPWTDLYALGASLYKLLTNETPPTSSEMIAMGGQLLFPPVVISQRMKKLITWMMKPSITERPQSAAEVRQFLDKPHVEQEEETVIDEPKPKIEEETVVTPPPVIPPVPPTPNPEPKPEPKPTPKPEPKPIPKANPQPSTFNPPPSKSLPWGIIVGVVMALLAFGGVLGYFMMSGISPVEEVVPQKEDPKFEIKIAYTSSLGDVGQYTGYVNADGKPDGWGKVAFENGNRYEGHFKNGLRDSTGTFTFKDGSVYKGTFKDDHFEKGTFEATDGSRFEGYFSSDNKPKNGIWYDKNGKDIEKVGDGYVDPPAPAE
jgi:serine/threonine-protein kinase